MQLDMWLEAQGLKCKDTATKVKDLQDHCRRKYCELAREALQAKRSAYTCQACPSVTGTNDPL